MNLFILFGSLLWLASLACLLLLLAVLLTIACVKRSWVFALLSIAATAGTALVLSGLFFAVGYWWFKPYDPTSGADLQRAYQADFGSLPPAGVTVLKARQVVIGDAGGQWLLLQVTPEEIDRHIAMGFTKAEGVPSDFDGAPGANAPKWWRPPAGLELYENRNWSKAGGWHSSQASVGVDRGSNLVWFAASKWD